MSVIQAATWFNTQRRATLTNPLSRAYLLELLNDPVNALTAVTLYRKLRLANALDVAAFQTVTTAYDELLARLPVNWQSALELTYLTQVVASISYDGLLALLLPLVRYKLDDAASPAVNSGSVGSAADGVVANATFQQAGPSTTIPKAYGYNATTTLLTIPTTPALQSVDFTVACLVNEVDKGEGSIGSYFDLYTTAPAAVITARHSNSLPQIVMTMNDVAAGSQSWITSTDITFGTWSWLFVQFNNTTKKVLAWKSVSSLLTAFVMGTDPTLGAAGRQIGGGYVGNNNVSGRTLNGKYAQFLLFGQPLLTTAQMQAIITKSGV